MGIAVLAMGDTARMGSRHIGDDMTSLGFWADLLGLDCVAARTGDEGACHTRERGRCAHDMQESRMVVQHTLHTHRE